MADNSLTYSPDSPYHGSSGFLNSLSEQQATALLDLQTHMINSSLNLADLAFNSLHPSLVLLRYLRANGFDVAKAAESIERNIEWRREHEVAKLCATQPQDILGCEMKRFTQLFPHWHCGYDKQRRPVLYKQYGGFECTELIKMTTVEKIAQYHIWEQEACMRLCMLQSLRSGYLVETITAVIDVAGMQMRQVDSSFMTIVKSIAEIDQKQYPETLGRFFIINTPYVFPIVWRMVKAFLDPVVASKIHIISKRSEWEPALLDYIGAENLSSTYGGTAPPLNSDLHPYAEIMLTWPKEDLLYDQGQSAVSAPFSLASPLMPSQGGGNTDMMNTFSPSLSSPSASTHDSASHSSGSSAFGDTMDGIDAWDQTVRGGVAGGSVLGILKGHEGWNYELQFLKASRENIAAAEKQKTKTVGFSQPSTQPHPEHDGSAVNATDKAPPKTALRTAAVTSQASFSSVISASSVEEEKRWCTCGGGFAGAVLLSLAGLKCFPSGCCSRLWTPLQARSINWLLTAFKYSLIIFTVLSIFSMIASAYALNSILALAPLKIEMWTGVAAMLLSSMTFLINITGIFGLKLKNRRLLLMYCACITAIVVAFITIAVVSSVFLSSSPLVRSYRDKAIGSLQGKSRAAELLKRYNMIVCIGSWLVAASAFLPLFFAAASSTKLEAIESRAAEGDDADDDDFFNDSSYSAPAAAVDVEMGSVGRVAAVEIHEDSDHVGEEEGTDKDHAMRRKANMGQITGEWRQWAKGQSTRRKRSLSSVLVKKLQVLSNALLDRRQLCVVVQVSLIVCLIFSLGMIGYGALSINYLLVKQYDYPIFPAYAILFCGVTLLIIVAYGLWASVVDQPAAIWVQKSIFIPAICVAVMGTATVSLGLLPGVREDIRHEQDSGNLHVDDGRKLEDNCEIQLLVQGLLGFAVLFFQLVCYVSFKELHELSGRIDELSKHVHELIYVVEGGHIDSGLKGAQLPSLAGGVHNRAKGLPSWSSTRTVANISKLGPHHHSPWANAEWMKEIGRLASQAADVDAGAFNGYSALGQNLYATDAFGGSGTIQSMYFSNDPIVGGQKLVIAMAYYRRWVYLRSIPALSFLDKVLITWGILVGIAFIYIKGTYVIFSSWVGDDSTPSWILALWKLMSLTDRRYSTSDDFLVSTEALLALIIGPMALLFSWSICARSSFRHPIGVFCSTADLYALLLSIAIEIRVKFKNVSLHNLTIFVLFFVAVKIIRGCTSFFVLSTESCQIAKKVDAFSKAQMQRRQTGRASGGVGR